PGHVRLRSPREGRGAAPAGGGHARSLLPGRGPPPAHPGDGSGGANHRGSGPLLLRQALPARGGDRSLAGGHGARPMSQRRSRGRRGGVAVPADRLLVGTNTVTIACLPSSPSIRTSEVMKPNTYSPLRGCSASTTDLNELRF